MPEELLLAITADNKLVHVGRPAGLLPHVVDEDEEAQFAGPNVIVPVWEFYDATGAPYQFVLDGDGKPVGFEPTPGRSSPTADDRQFLVDRIAASMANLQVFLNKEIQAKAFNGAEPPRRRIPQVSGELPDVLTMVFALAPAIPGNPPGPGSFVHNLWHAVVG